MEAKLQAAVADGQPAKPAVAASHDLCRPWNRPDFLCRVKSFSIRTWFGKPACLSPLECARFGWWNASTDTVKCRSCNAQLTFQFPSQLSAEVS